MMRFAPTLLAASSAISLEEKYIKRSGVNYIDKCDYTVYENIDEFFEKNKGTYYFLTRYGHKPHTSFDYSNNKENIYFILIIF